jgi:hypothetical protein
MLRADLHAPEPPSMPGRTFHLLATCRWIVVAVVLCVLATACTRTPPEAALRRSMDGLHEALEERDARGVARFLAEDFIGPGSLDRDGARRLAALHFMRYADIRVLPGPLDIELRDGHARVRFSALLSGGDTGRALPDSARAWQVDTGWRLDDGEWLMTSAEWAPR